MKDRLSDGLTNHNSKLCIICNPEAASSDLESGEDFHPSSKVFFLGGECYASLITHVLKIVGLSNKEM